MHPKYQKAIDLRFQGKSYREIANILGVSKSSVSNWCKNLTLPLEARNIIQKKSKASLEKLADYNRRKHEKVQKENIDIKKKACNQIKAISDNELLLLGVALYWAEGYKKQANNRSPYISFANSDAQMIVLFMNFLYEIMDIKSSEIKAVIHIYPTTNKIKAIKFWQDVTKLPKKSFRFIQQISRASKQKRDCNSLPYGTLHLRVYRRQYFYQLMGWIEGLSKRADLN